MDAKLYRAFWGLQHAFQHPYQTLDPARWAGAVRDLNLVLEAFGRLPIAAGRSAGSSASELGLTARPAPEGLGSHLMSLDLGDELAFRVGRGLNDTPHLLSCRQRLR